MSTDKSIPAERCFNLSSKSKGSLRYRLKIKRNKCKGCGLCVESCRRGVLELSSDLNPRGAAYVKVKDEAGCIGCGFCFLMCPDVCIEIYIEDR